MRPMRKQNLRPQMSVSLLPGIMSAAMVSVKAVMAVWTPLTVVPRSVAMLLMATFIVVPAKLHRNWARTRGSSIAPAAACAGASAVTVSATPEDDLAIGGSGFLSLAKV